MWTINGIGTKLCGGKKIASDGSYQATKWFVIFFMPIIPLKTFRVLEIPKYNLLGEDGIIEEIFKRMNIKNGSCVEFGANDGIFCSNKKIY